MDIRLVGIRLVTRAYSCTWALAPSSASGTNTATATWDKTAAHTPNGSATGTATFAFSSPTITDGSVLVTDTNAVTFFNPLRSIGGDSYTDASPKIGRATRRERA